MNVFFKLELFVDNDSIYHDCKDPILAHQCAVLSAARLSHAIYVVEARAVDEAI